MTIPRFDLRHGSHSKSNFVKPAVNEGEMTICLNAPKLFALTLLKTKLRIYVDPAIGHKSIGHVALLASRKKNQSPDFLQSNFPSTEKSNSNMRFQGAGMMLVHRTISCKCTCRWTQLLSYKFM
jgi:hypothetical protein